MTFKLWPLSAIDEWFWILRWRGWSKEVGYYRGWKFGPFSVTISDQKK